MNLVQIKQIIKAHGSQNTDDCGEIQALISFTDKYVSVGLDSTAKAWSYDHQLLTTTNIHGDYPLCIKHINKHIIIGNGRG
jgi:hypothetical protein